MKAPESVSAFDETVAFSYRRRGVSYRSVPVPRSSFSRCDLRLLSVVDTACQSTRRPSETSSCLTPRSEYEPGTWLSSGANRDTRVRPRHCYTQDSTVPGIDLHTPISVTACRRARRAKAVPERLTQGRNRVTSKNAATTMSPTLHSHRSHDSQELQHSRVQEAR